VAVASAGPYASLHLAPDRQPRQHPTTRFLQAGCPSCRPTNNVKALKAHLTANLYKYLFKLGGDFWLLLYGFFCSIPSATKLFLFCHLL